MSATHETKDMALLSGGGSGGHVFPGLAVAEELTRRGWKVGWAGSARSLESKLVARQKIPFYPLPARPVMGQGPAGKVRAAATLLVSAWKARSLVRRIEAGVVVGTGGYVSAPTVVGGRLARRPVMLFEPNADVGLANRWLSRMASEAVVAHQGTAEQLSCPAWMSGVPVRAEFFRGGADLPPAEPRRLLVLGGSQGARQLNELLPPALASLAKRSSELDFTRIEVCHQTGERNLEATKAAYRQAGIELGDDASLGVEVTPFLHDMAEAMNRSHLIMSRAGAITLAEICAAGRASVLVPLRSLAAGHQLGNAQRLKEAEAGDVLPADADAESLADLLARRLGDLQILAAMGRAARGLARPDSASRIADRITELGRRNTGGAS